MVNLEGMQVLAATKTTYSKPPGASRADVGRSPCTSDSSRARARSSFVTSVRPCRLSRPS